MKPKPQASDGEEDVLLRKGTSGTHPVDQVWGTLRLDRPVDEILDEMRGPRPSREAAKAARRRS
jgi:hypothetical protein